MVFGQGIKRKFPSYNNTTISLSEIKGGCRDRWGSQLWNWRSCSAWSQRGCAESCGRSASSRNRSRAHGRITREACTIGTSKTLSSSRSSGRYSSTHNKRAEV